MEPALRLPFDERTAELAEVRVAVALPAAPDDVLISAFAAWLGRITGQAEIPLRIARAGGAVVDAVVTPATGTRTEAAPGAAPPIAMIALAGTPPVGAQLALVVTTGELAYNGRAFHAATAARFAGQLATLAAALAADPAADVAHLPLLPPAERAALDAFGHGAPRAHEDHLAPIRFAQLAAATPDAIAVRYRDAHLTYGQLAARVRALAAVLIARGVAAEARVAVTLEPSLDIAVALLAILTAGGVYVPVEPTYPIARIRAILDGTKPTMVITQRALVTRLELGGEPILVLDEVDRDHPPAAAPAISPAQTAYIYFTSGTTGAPKGVMASHANLAFYLQVARERYAITARDVMPAIARFSFSISMFELLSPLLAGGTLVVLDREHVMDPARMAATLAQITFIHAGPSLWKHVLPHLDRHPGEPGALAGVRHASSGGDLIAPELLATLARTFPAAEIFVIYGSSEISCMGCTYPVARDALPTRTFVGRPFEDTTVRLLDAAGERVPIGVVGEIHFAGGGVVGGYLERPELTADRFRVRDADGDRARFYGMGDMGRWSADGWLEILGRNDYQIKIRGMRVELGEVDLHVRRAPGVKDAVVIAQPGPGGDPRMVAYVVLHAGQTAAAAIPGIRRHLLDTLPDYMVPAQYVELAALPVNHNLKLDRNALPALVAAPRATARAPESATERGLAAIWRDLLGAPVVSLDDNFFELGGDSLHALELLVRAERELGARLDGMDVLRETLEVLAAACDRALGRAVATRAAPAAPARDRVTAFHFGPRGELYGVLHGDPGRAARDAVLIVPPIGQERMRTQFVLARLARQLAAAGTPTLRFDLFGQGDSLGDDRDGSCARWHRDIADAVAELRTRTGAARVVAIGARLGATLLATADVAVARLVLWDPIARGARYHGELAELHGDYVRALQHLQIRRRAPRPADGAELLGVRLSTAALRELDALALPARGPTTPPIGWLATSDPREHAVRFAALAGDDPASRLVTLDVHCAWREIAQLEDMLPDVGISRALAELAEVSA